MPKKAVELKASQLGRLGDGVHAVGGCDGLALQVAGVSRCWVLRVAAQDGRRLTIGLGSAQDYGLAEARQRGIAMRKRVRDEGYDPRRARQAAKAQAIAEAVQGVTFQQAAEDFIAANRAGWKNEKHARQWVSTLQTYAFPTLGDLSVAAIEPAHVLTVLKQPVDGGTLWTQRTETATRLRERIEKVIGAADAQAGRQRLNPARWKGCIDAMLPRPNKIKTVEHHASMDWRQVPDFVAELKKREGTAAKALLFAILTAARSGEVRGATWAEIDLQARLWRIPASRMKAGRAHTVPLSDQAIECLGKAGAPDAIVFAAPRGKALSDMSLSAVLKRMNVASTVHGFRSSFRTWGQDAGDATHEVLEAALAHVAGDATVQAYARGDALDKRVALMHAWADFVAASPASNVIALHGAA